MPGPVPKRDAERRRRNTPAAPTTRARAAAKARAPRADKDWHPVAKRIYESLPKSGQSVFYGPSDYAVAYLMAESMSRDLKPQFVGFVQTGRDTTEPAYEEIPLKGTSLSAYLKALTALLATEGDRRRHRLELERVAEGSQEIPAGVVAMDDYRDALGG